MVHDSKLLKDIIIHKVLEKHFSITITIRYIFTTKSLRFRYKYVAYIKVLTLSVAVIYLRQITILSWKESVIEKEYKFTGVIYYLNFFYSLSLLRRITHYCVVDDIQEKILAVKVHAIHILIVVGYL